MYYYLCQVRHCMNAYGLILKAAANPLLYVSGSEPTSTNGESNVLSNQHLRVASDEYLLSDDSAFVPPSPSKSTSAPSRLSWSMVPFFCVRGYFYIVSLYNLNLFVLVYYSRCILAIPGRVRR